MSKYGVRDETEQALAARMAVLKINESDLLERFIRGSGKGGQKINRTSSCVVLRHLPSGIEVRCQKERSQALNRFHARRELCRKLELLQRDSQLQANRELNRLRKQKRKRSKRAKEKLLADKKAHSTKKSLRSKLRRSDE